MQRSNNAVVLVSKELKDAEAVELLAKQDIMQKRIDMIEELLESSPNCRSEVSKGIRNEGVLEKS